MKRGYSYVVTLLSICLIYAGSLYFVSKTTTTSYPVLEKDEIIIEDTLSESCTINYTTVEQEVVKREKAVIVILVRNNELNPMRRTLREFEE